jgi:hypothetical protein
MCSEEHKHTGTPFRSNQATTITKYPLKPTVYKHSNLWTKIVSDGQDSLAEQLNNGKKGFIYAVNGLTLPGMGKNFLAILELVWAL